MEKKPKKFQDALPLERKPKTKVQEKLPLSIFPFIGPCAKKLPVPSPSQIKMAQQRVRKVAIKLKR